MAGTREKRKLKVGVIRGGPSDQYDVSIKSGQSVIDSLRAGSSYEVQDVFIDRGGSWHIDGIIRPVDRIFPHVDVIFNALHGQYGEDGRVQQLLEAHNMPFTGSGSFSSALGMNKPLAKKFFREHGLLTPEHLVIKKHEHTPGLIERILKRYPHLKLIKPASSGLASGVAIAKNYEDFEDALNQAFMYSDSVLVEEFIRGREATCGVLEDSEGRAHALHPIEVQDMLGDRQAIHPGNFTEEEVQKIMQSAVDAHRALGLRHYSRSDFIVTKRGVYILESNTLPGLTSTSFFPKTLSVAGISIGEFVDHVIDLALKKR